MPEITNQLRSDRITAALKAHAETTGEDFDPADQSLTNLACLMADILHWCAKHKVDFSDAERLARIHFDEECEDES
jgi:hypothetical protein